MRQRTLLRLDSFADLTEQFGCMETMGATARLMAMRLRSLWPPESDRMPLYPAFRGMVNAKQVGGVSFPKGKGGGSQRCIEYG